MVSLRGSTAKRRGTMIISKSRGYHRTAPECYDSRKSDISHCAVFEYPASDPLIALFGTPGIARSRTPLGEPRLRTSSHHVRVHEFRVVGKTRRIYAPSSKWYCNSPCCKLQSPSLEHRLSQ